MLPRSVEDEQVSIKYLGGASYICVHASALSILEIYSAPQAWIPEALAHRNASRLSKRSVKLRKSCSWGTALCFGLPELLGSTYPQDLPCINPGPS